MPGTPPPRDETLTSASYRGLIKRYEGRLGTR